jgi:dTDP-4-dehydrorhamnose reductase
VVGTYFTHPMSVPGAVAAPLDISDVEHVHDLFSLEKPEVVVHCAALVNADYCETNPQDAEKINLQGSLAVFEAAARVGAKVVFMSSSYVFSGDSGPYREQDEPDPINRYGGMKLQAERRLQSMDAESLIARTTVLYGWNVGPQRLNFVTWLIQQLGERKRVNIVTDQTATPSYVWDVARAVLGLVKTRKHGIYNVVGPDSMSRHDLSLLVAEVFGLDRTLITAITSSLLGQAARRPVDDSLVVAKASEALGDIFRSPRAALVEMQARGRSGEARMLSG